MQNYSRRRRACAWMRSAFSGWGANGFSITMLSAHIHTLNGRRCVRCAILSWRYAFAAQNIHTKVCCVCVPLFRDKGESVNIWLIALCSLCACVPRVWYAVRPPTCRARSRAKMHFIQFQRPHLSSREYTHSHSKRARTLTLHRHTERTLFMLSNYPLVFYRDGAARDATLSTGFFNLVNLYRHLHRRHLACVSHAHQVYCYMLLYGIHPTRLRHANFVVRAEQCEWVRVMRVRSCARSRAMYTTYACRWRIMHLIMLNELRIYLLWRLKHCECANCD